MRTIERARRLIVGRGGPNERSAGRIGAGMLAAIGAVAWLTSAAPAMAQRGVGGDVGVARMAQPPAVVVLEGKLVEIKTGPCENRVDDPRRAPIGTHIILESSEGKRLNVHLGPARAVAEIVKQLATDQKLAVHAFRTDALPADHFVAQRIVAGEKSLELRDAALRPVWAGGGQAARGGAGGGQGPGQGRNAAQFQGRGTGQGGGPAGPGWGAGGGRSPGAGRGAAGRGPGRGPGGGRGPGAGQGAGRGW